MIQIYFLEVDDSAYEWEDLLPLVSLVSPERQERINRTASLTSKKLCLYAELLLRFHVCQRLQESPALLTIATGEHGKPYLADYPDIHFNWSNTGNTLVLGFSDQEIGVDAEYIRPANLKLVHRFFTETENAYILEKTAETDERFTRIWTRKEAYVKCDGRGLTMPLHSFDVISTEEITSRLFTSAHGGCIFSVCQKAPAGFDSMEYTDLTESELMDGIRSFMAGLQI